MGVLLRGRVGKGLTQEVFAGRRARAGRETGLCLHGRVPGGRELMGRAGLWTTDRTGQDEMVPLCHELEVVPLDLTHSGGHWGLCVSSF